VKICVCPSEATGEGAVGHRGKDSTSMQLRATTHDDPQKSTSPRVSESPNCSWRKADSPAAQLDFLLRRADAALYAQQEWRPKSRYTSRTVNDARGPDGGVVDAPLSTCVAGKVPANSSQSVILLEPSGHDAYALLIVEPVGQRRTRRLSRKGARSTTVCSASEPI